MQLPSDIEEIKARLGLISNRIMGLPEIRKCQEMVSEWFVSAAEEKWGPEIWHMITDPTERLRTATLAGAERWEGIGPIIDALNRAERCIIRGSEPIA